MDLSSQLTVFLISSGEPSTAECEKRLLAQDCTFRLKRIVNVSPMDRAFQCMLDQCETPFYVQVDADMMLEPWAIQQLYGELFGRSAETAMFVGWLWGDAEERPIQGIKVYRHVITRRYPYTSSLSCEVPQIEAMKADGYTVVAQSLPMERTECYGLHFSLQTPEIAFSRQQRLAAKFRARPYMSWWREMPRLLVNRWMAEPTEINEFAVLGAVAGMVGPPMSDAESDVSRPNLDYRRLMPILGDWVKGPVGLNLYVTDRCNAKCIGCWRTTNPPEKQAQLDPAVVESVLETFPTVRAVCLAGFGEPLMHPNLGGIISVCKERSLWVTVITNGILLMQRAEEIQAWRPSRVSVSLNATNAEEHSVAQGGTKCWDSVLEGISKLVGAGGEVGLSYIARRSNVCRLVPFLALAKRLGVRCVDFPNLLPHDGPTDPTFLADVLTVQCPELVHVEIAKNSPGAELVTHWPTAIDLVNPPPLKCDSPFRSIGVDARGWVTPCRRLAPPGSGFGHYMRGSVWSDITFVDLRLAMTGDRPLPPECRACFGCWSG